VYLWRAVDQSGEVLDALVQKRRDGKPAKRFFRKLPKGQRYVPRAIVTDKLASYAAAKKELMPSVTHHRGRGLNNRAKNSHQPTRARTRHAPLQVDEAGPTMPLGACASVESFSTWPPLYAGVPLSHIDDRAVCVLV
jgi:transposase-like protein